jgi:hypothetical protein
MRGGSFLEQGIIAYGDAPRTSRQRAEGRSIENFLNLLTCQHGDGDICQLGIIF